MIVNFMAWSAWQKYKKNEIFFHQRTTILSLLYTIFPSSVIPSITTVYVEDLTYDEQTIYEMIAGRMLEAFSPKCIKDATTITLTCADTIFEAKGSVVKQAGWLAVFNEQEEKDDDVGNLPEVTQGESLPMIQSEVLEKHTKPHPCPATLETGKKKYQISRRMHWQLYSP